MPEPQDVSISAKLSSPRAGILSFLCWLASASAPMSAHFISGRLWESTQIVTDRLVGIALYYGLIRSILSRKIIERVAS